MGIAAHFIHRCTIERAERLPDAYNADREVWKPSRDGVLCRLVAKTQRVLDSATGERPIVTTYTLLLPRHIDIKTSDRIVNIVDRSGNVDRTVYQVAAVLPRNARGTRHISVQLDRISAARPQGDEA